ncbi:MAG: alpha-ketoglutarate-dependent dioxygenase AlkB [Acidobacteria bacterium]|nr:MAG: alpha-ketoglutarate-dependent dioxygenase AlkB [Acidobacteriota bacterium]
MMGTKGDLPEGFVYQPDFMTADEEKALLADIARLEFSTLTMHGVTARRRVIHYGWLYGYESFKITPGPPIPEFLLPIRERAARTVEVQPDELGEALLTEYSAGATIGWHRDAPAFGVVLAVSLAGSCRLRFQKGRGSERQTAELVVEPRSLYVLSGVARNQWQHSIPPTKELRYSITFRTLRRENQ